MINLVTNGELRHAVETWFYFSKENYKNKYAFQYDAYHPLASHTCIRPSVATRCQYQWLWDPQENRSLLMATRCH